MIGFSLLINIFGCFFALFLRRDMLNPLFIFNFVWGASLALLFIFASDFYAVGMETEFIYVVGFVAVIVGYVFSESLFGNGFNYSKAINSRITVKPSFLWALIIILILGWFEYYREICALTSGGSFFTSFQEARYALVQATFSGEKLIGPIANFEVLSLYVAMLCYLERNTGDYSKIRAVLSLIIALFYVILGGAKGGLVTLALVLYLLHAFCLPWRTILRTGIVVFIIVLVLFSLGLITVNYTYNEFNGYAELFVALFKSIRNYWVGGIVAFDQVVNSPNNFEHFQSVTRFFLETANSLGFDFYVPSVHAAYVNISNEEDTNVFTIFFSYYLDAGFFGVFLLFFLYSSIITYVYLKARSGDARYVLLYALLAVGLMLSIISERFFLGLNGLIKSVLFWWLSYGLFPRVTSVKQSGGHGLERSV